MTTETKPLSELPVDHPDQPWNMDFAEAKLMLYCFLRDVAETREEKELVVMLYCFMNSALWDQLIEWQRIGHLARDRGTPIGDHLFEIALRHPVDADRIREHQDAINRARKDDPDAD